ncbi:MAG: tRNA uridine-5-carboxymethylaminomethyl(34) synthesis GTPase MnmE [Gammaproteobacteria bacterium]
MRDTIAAIATARGVGGVGIVRVSGPQAAVIAESVLGALPRARVATFTPFKDRNGEVLDEGLALWFPAPHSFTGEDVLELQGHGGPVVLDRLLAAVLAQGARLANPGEFSERAYLEGKLDLVQAEAIADLIESGSEQAARAALHSLQGEFSSRIHALVEQLTRLRIQVEATLDFPEEEIDFFDEAALNADFLPIVQGLEAVIAQAREGARLRDGFTVVLAGPPNVGKSSILNALAQTERAIVTPIAGTTRDVLRETILLDGMPLHVIDTAGLRDSDDPVEQEGIRRARAEMERAERILLIEDASSPVDAAESVEMDAKLASLPNVPRTYLRNKIDLADASAGWVERAGKKQLQLSAQTGAGMDQLKTHLRELAGLQSTDAGGFSARRRHVDALLRARCALEDARARLHERAGELFAQDLLSAQNALGEITGTVTPDDLLGRIFSEFCIGK